MAKSRLVVLDTVIILVLHQLEVWRQVLSTCEVTLTESVFGESQHYYNKAGEKVYIDLEPDRREKRITVVEVSVSDTKAFRNQFQPLYFEKLDEGETDSLVYALNKGGCRICSADAIVDKVLAVLDREDCGVSLEQLLREIGLSRNVPNKCSEEFRKNSLKSGREDNVRERALKKR